MSDEMKVFACWNTFCECEKKMLVELSQTTRDEMDRLNPQNVHLMHLSSLLRETSLPVLRVRVRQAEVSV